MATAAESAKQVWQALPLPVNKVPSFPVRTDLGLPKHQPRNGYLAPIHVS